MANLKEEAQNYEPAKTKNIAELDSVQIDVKVRDETYKEGTTDEFKLKVITIDAEDYRVPVSVLKSLKAILEEKPNLKSFKVKKTGLGLSTEYTVVPLD